jgi:hypothetical protein
MALLYQKREALSRDTYINNLRVICGRGERKNSLFSTFTIFM